jgi:hypothetical protein
VKKIPPPLPQAHIGQAIDTPTTIWGQGTRLVDPDHRWRVSKFQPCLPRDIEHGLIARETRSADAANSTFVRWTRDGDEGGGNC